MKYKGKRSLEQVEDHKLKKHPLLSGDPVRVDEFLAGVRKTEDIIDVLRVLALSIKPK